MEAPDRRIPWAKLGFEFLAITFSGMLALGANQWRESRRERKVLVQALQSLRSESERNRQRVAKALDHHQELLKNTKKGEQHGLQPAFVTDSAWQTARTTGAVGSMDYALASRFTSVYQLQSDYRDVVHSAMGLLYFANAFGDSPGLHASEHAMAPLLQDLVAFEQGLLSLYDQAIKDADQKVKELS